MALNDAWRRLQQSRFPDLPLDCGEQANPGVTYSEDLRDWSDKAKTPDQARMEQYLDRFDLRGKRILHIGIGDSGLARRFHHRAREIVGTTIDNPEMKVARSLAIPGYRFLVHNKYSGGCDEIEGGFDFILDNNLTSPCCCMRHLSDMFDFYATKLADDGQIVTDSQGLGWVPNETNPRWSFDFNDLTAAAETAGFSVYRMSSHTYVVARALPQRPDGLSLAQHWLRRGRRLPGQIARHGPGRINRALRRAVKQGLGTIAPWALPVRHRPGKQG